ncbi:energy transducer TonB [Terriglobus roseus]|uniref:Protein TonB n=1 Tax=Terriglobus roseus TaxID=392734 RepID=A0A1H4JIB5_9BACT|nr:energy transducer TonB [Terriglobus roseus]SEB46064.1 protein TonB [Terriglobus roseus]
MLRLSDLRRRLALIPAAAPRARGVRWLETLPGRAMFSACLHLLALLVLVNAWWMGAPRLKPAGTATGRHVLVTYNPGKPAPLPPTPPRRAMARRYPRANVLPVVADDASAAPPVQGNDALGTGTVSLLYVQAFPGQKPDLSGAGTTGDVIVEVEIDDTGHVAQVHARRGMGAQIDDLVVATVERWLFHPAMRNGHAVASERELRFHFDRRRNENCGWECFALEE